MLQHRVVFPERLQRLITLGQRCGMGSALLGNDPFEGLRVVGKLDCRIIHDTDISYALSSGILQ